MAFMKIERRKIADQIATSLRDAIVGGQLEAGDSLPAERKLADRFGVNRSSIREAIHRLEAWGLVETRHGDGTRVSDYLTTAGLHLLPHLLAPGGALDPKLYRDLLEIRALLLGWTAKKAATLVVDDDVEALKTLLKELGAAQKVDGRQTLDFQFYEKLVALTQNRVLALLSNAIRRVYLVHHHLFTDLYDDAHFTLQYHHDVIAALEKGDVHAAEGAMAAYGALAFLTLKGDEGQGGLA